MQPEIDDVVRGFDGLFRITMITTYNGPENDWTVVDETGKSRFIYWNGSHWVESKNEGVLNMEV